MSSSLPPDHPLVRDNFQAFSFHGARTRGHRQEFRALLLVSATSPLLGGFPLFLKPDDSWIVISSPSPFPQSQTQVLVPPGYLPARALSWLLELPAAKADLLVFPRRSARGR